MIFAAVGAYLMFAIERPVIRSPMYLAGVVAVMAGTAGAVLLGDVPVTGAHALGIAMAVTSGALFACYALAVRKYMNGFNSVVAFAAISQYTAAAMVALMLLIGRRGGLEALDMGGRDFVLLLISAVIGIALGHVLYYMSINRLGVAVSSGVLQLHPFTTGVASYFIFREMLTGAQWISGCVAVGGAVLMLGVQARISRRGMQEPALAVPVPSTQRG
jgi:drug/metabolite transporter (DMT)-like permease